MEQPLYDVIGTDYNSTRCADPFLTGRMFSLLAPPGDLPSLDVGCGTGNYTIALASRGHKFYGVEPSRVMLDAARLKSDAVVWTRARAEDLPFENESFGAALASLTIHHWEDLEKGFREIHRVLRAGSGFVVFSSFPEQMKTYWLNHYFPRMMEDSTAVMPDRPTLYAALNAAGFEDAREEKYFVRPDLRDLFLYCGKHRPRLYFDARVRAGISSFSALSNRVEVEDGLRKLAADLATGDFAGIARSYESEAGDYIFIAAAKS